MTSGALLADFDAILLDLDGTVYRGRQAVAGAADTVRAINEAGVAVRFVTNNASRSPDAVAEHLRAIDIPATRDEVATSAQAAAGVLADKLPAGAHVLVVGTPALVDEVATRGLRPVRTADGDVSAVVQGLSPDAGWRDLAEACVAIRQGALWVACNVDPTLPTERGELPGNGSLVAALRVATQTDPIVAGKPQRPLMDDAIRSAQARRPLAVGDRLDTDVAGAHAVGIEALLVLSGVSTPADLVAAQANHRPKYLAADIGGLLRTAAELAIAPHKDWSIEVADGQVRIGFTGTTADPLDALRALCAAWWAQHPHAALPAIAAVDDQAGAALVSLMLVRA
jgi:HAD superfamily hydrolase (TIGR01450 family)